MHSQWCPCLHDFVINLYLILFFYWGNELSSRYLLFFFKKYSFHKNSISVWCNDVFLMKNLKRHITWKKIRSKRIACWIYKILYFFFFNFWKKGFGSMMFLFHILYGSIVHIGCISVTRVHTPRTFKVVFHGVTYHGMVRKRQQ